MMPIIAVSNAMHDVDEHHGDAGLGHVFDGHHVDARTGHRLDGYFVAGESSTMEHSVGC